VLVVGLVFAGQGFAQSNTTGAIAGVVADPSGAVVPNAKVTATHNTTGVSYNATTNGQGSYHFQFLPPGSYTVAVSAAGFQAASQRVEVTLGQTANGKFALAVTGATTTVEVTTLPTQIDNGNISTNFSSEQIASVPNPGNDLSAIAQTAPGAVMNTQSGFGNLSVYGLPGTSNLFTLDGQNNNDPFLNLNNSGATNLLLGTNELQQSTVTSNGYSGLYGQLAGAQINYVTKSGGNHFHGNAVYQWNGRAMNANSFLNNLTSTPRPFDNVNQWAASFGGPIVKDRTFFFWDFEGLRIVLPTSNAAFIPTTAFETATLARVGSLSTPGNNLVPFYQQMFGLWEGAAGASRAVAQPVSSSCAAVSAAFPGLVPAGTPCTSKFTSTAGNFTHEYLTALRIDHKFNDNDNIFARVQTDQGTQATSTDAINPLFNVQSVQPEYQGQLGWTHVLNSSQVNEFKASGQWYSAIFTQPDRAAALAAFPTVLQLGDASFSALGGGATGASFAAVGQDFPQGRNVTNYQFIDDFSWIHGNHTWKFGVNFHRSLVTDSDPQQVTAGLVTVNTLVDFFNGGNGTAFGGAGNTLTQNFPSRLTQPFALYGVGFYGQDEWRVTKQLRVTVALRLDHNSNPVCLTNCFSRLVTPFTSLNHTNSANLPYNQTIVPGFTQAYPSTDFFVWQPRLGFAYSPLPNNKTVIRGGVGIFSDSFPATIVDTLIANSPTLNSFTLNNVNYAGPAGPSAAAIQTNNTFLGLTPGIPGFFQGGTPNSIGVTPPGFTSTDVKVRQPRYQEWNLEVQQNLGADIVLSANYVGNHGIFEPIENTGLNGFFNPTLFPSGFGGLPVGVFNTFINGGTFVGPDARFGVVNQVQSIGVSNYNGLTASLRKQFSHGFAFQANYTWSHALDRISNGGLLPFNDTTNISTISPFNPFNVAKNYGNADYDVRNYFSANYLWDNAVRHLFHWGPDVLFKGWLVSGTVFTRSGLPFTVVDRGTGSLLQGSNFQATNPGGLGYTIPAQIVGGSTASVTCGGEATVTPCLNINGFAPPTGLATNQERNQFRGPNYFDTDMAVMKYTYITESVNIGLGVQFFNLFNHPNFDQPINDINNSGFGTIINHVNTPTSVLGSFLGGDASPRLIQIKAELRF
jgi:hypothetical protein